MSERNDGGPAFPVEVNADGEGKQTGPYSGMATGMTLRDYFAAKAMKGLLAGQYSDSGKYNLDDLPAESYKIADAMLKERKK